jgi:hypothetical protein
VKSNPAVVRFAVMFGKFLVSALLAAGLAATAHGAEVTFDFRQAAVDQAPPDFVSLVTGPGAPAEWKVIEESVPPILPPLSPNAPATAMRPVLSVNSTDMNRHRFAALLYTNDAFQDFTFTTRLKILGGSADPSAGIVFRAQDAGNYYVLRAGAEGYLLWHRVVEGKSIESLGVGVRTPIATGDWMELKVECKGTGIRGFLNGKLLIPPGKPGAPTDELAVNDSTFASGKIGFWAKADTSAEFADARLQFTPRIPYMQSVAAEIMKKYPRLRGLDIYAPRPSHLPVIVASKDTNHLGVAGGKAEEDVLQRGTIYYVKDKGWVEVTLPLRDRNGDVAAALKTRMDRFPGETQDTALARAVIVKKAVEERLDTMQNIME